MIQLAGNAFKGQRQPTADNQPPGSLDSDRTLRPEALLLFKRPVDFLSWLPLDTSCCCVQRNTQVETYLSIPLTVREGAKTNLVNAWQVEQSRLSIFTQSAKITIISTVLLQEGKLFGSNWDYQHFGGLNTLNIYFFFFCLTLSICRRDQFRSQRLERRGENLFQKSNLCGKRSPKRVTV